MKFVKYFCIFFIFTKALAVPVAVAAFAIPAGSVGKVSFCGGAAVTLPTVKIAAVASATAASTIKAVVIAGATKLVKAVNSESTAKLLKSTSAKISYTSYAYTGLYYARYYVWPTEEQELQKLLNEKAQEKPLFERIKEYREQQKNLKAA